MMMLPVLSMAYGIEITRFIHTETQDGKSVLDAHFARAMQVIYIMHNRYYSVLDVAIHFFF